jgi:hypothetical protein
MPIKQPRVVTTIELSGPFFRRDPRKTFRQNVREMMAAVAVEAEQDVRAKMRAGEASRRPMRGIAPNRVSRWVVGRVRSRAGRKWEVTAVVSVNNSGLTKRQGITLMAAAARVEMRTKAFRRMTARMRRARAINQAELLKGLQ